MQRTTAKVFGFLVLGLGLIGLVAGEGHLLGIMNMDAVLDLTRLALAALLLYAVYAAGDNRLVRTGLIVLSVLYLGIGLFGLADPTIGGLLPNGLTSFDILFHLASGAFALYAAAMTRDNVLLHR
ncbi:hypothetical protein JNJ66_02570 [Candidatus Saccharibacteria bacterium]|nr:hypothetical protein [Candidatus Saccharibacteria bacterium]